VAYGPNLIPAKLLNKGTESICHGFLTCQVQRVVEWQLFFLIAGQIRGSPEICSWLKDTGRLICTLIDCELLQSDLSNVSSWSQ